MVAVLSLARATFFGDGTNLGAIGGISERGDPGTTGGVRWIQHQDIETCGSGGAMYVGVGDVGYGMPASRLK